MTSEPSRLQTEPSSSPIAPAPTTRNFSGSFSKQSASVLLTIVWSGVVAFVAYKIVDLTVGLRVAEEEEREGLDISSHGETAYAK